MSITDGANEREGIVENDSRTATPLPSNITDLNVVANAEKSANFPEDLPRPPIIDQENTDLEKGIESDQNETTTADILESMDGEGDVELETIISLGGEEDPAESTIPLMVSAPDAEAEFLAVVRFCISIGKAAFRYGSPGSKVEAFLQRLLEDRFGYYSGIFRATQSELMCSVCLGEDDPPRTFLVSLTPGLNLHKLGLLADLVDRVVGDNSEGPLATRPEALNEMKAIEKESDPWCSLMVFASFPIVGAGLSVLLAGSWWDCMMGAFLSISCFAAIEYLPKIHRRLHQWVPLVAAFLISTVATVVKLRWLPTLNVTLASLSSLAVLLPGYPVSMGIGELISNRIISGAANLIGGMVTMLWLVLGAWLGDAMAQTVTKGGLVDEDDLDTDDSVPMVWQALFVPLLCFSLIVAFQVSRRDAIWCFLHLMMTYSTFVLSGYLLQWSLSDADLSAASSILSSAPGRRNLQTFLSSVASCVAANFWAIRWNRPNSILLVPALVFLVSGSIGFQGLLTFFLQEDESEKSVGKAQFMQMIIVALLIVAGLLTGNTLLEPSTTL